MVSSQSFRIVILLSIFFVSGSALYSIPETAVPFVERLFEKYGVADYNNETVLQESGLDTLMRSLALGSVNVVCELNDTQCLRNKYGGHLVARSDPLLSRRRRGLNDVAGAKSSNNIAHNRDWMNHVQACMTVRNFTVMYKFNRSAIKKTDFMNLCPSLVTQIDEKVCIHYHKRFPRLKRPDKPPSPSETWGYGFLAITICSLLSLVVIAMIPCLKKSFYNLLMAYLVAVAVGTLAGDALLHLIPHAFIEGANLAAEIVISKGQKERQHVSMVWRAMFVIVGVYIFFIVEQFMKLRAARQNSSSKHEHHSHHHEVATTEENIVDNDKDEHYDHSHEEHHQDNHGHSHGSNKVITGETRVSSVAWMVIVGDGFHNFSDGLAVGAAFSASISSGVSTTIAIFCHELPHELGDFAILLKAGMTIKQAMVYNLVSAVLAYVGLAIGILAGEGELGRHIILCLTAGLFLYIALVDMMGEVTEHATKSGIGTIISQHLGLISGIGIMLVISLYEP